MKYCHCICEKGKYTCHFLNDNSYALLESEALAAMMHKADLIGLWFSFSPTSTHENTLFVTPTCTHVCVCTKRGLTLCSYNSSSSSSSRALHQDTCIFFHHTSVPHQYNIAGQLIFKSFQFSLFSISIYFLSYSLIVAYFTK